MNLRAVQSPRWETLILYTFSASDPEYRANFQYFLDYGLGGHNVFYAIIVQQAGCYHA